MSDINDVINSVASQVVMNPVEDVKPEKRLSKREQELDDLIAQYKKQIAESETLNERLKNRLELVNLESERKRVGNEATPGLRVVGSFNEPIVFDLKAKPFMEKDPGKKYRWINTNRDIMDMRKSTGYKAVLEDNGQEVRYGDLQLMAIKPAEYEEMIGGPARRRRKAMRDSVTSQYTEMGHEYKVPVFGKITYDDGTETVIGEDR